MMASRGGALVVVLIVLCSLPVQPLQACATKNPRLVPAMFVFGDSLVDVGNNHHLPNVNNSCKANYHPYGIDYPLHSPTGRFSNGHNLADQLAKLLGFEESPPPFFSLTKNATARRLRFSRLAITGGINFASGGSGLQPKTGNSVCGGQVVSMADQVGHFKSLAQKWQSKKRKQRAAAADLISNSLVLISVGSNDLFEYSDSVALDPNFIRNDTAFLHNLTDLYTGYVNDLYAAGATKFSVVSPSLVGCCPSQRKIANETKDMDDSGCFRTANSLSMQLYPMIDSMLQNLSQKELPGMSYSLLDTVGLAQHALALLGNASNDFYQPCCSSGDFGGNGCDGSAQLCPEPERSFVIFWDRYHPTQTVSLVTALELFFGSDGTHVHPVSVQQLVAARRRRSHELATFYK